MRILAIALLLFCSAFTASAQTSRFQLGAVSRSENIALEGRGHGWITSTGIVTAVSVAPSVSVEAEITSATKRINRSYESGFMSIASPNSSREEIERLMISARRSLEYVPGAGGSVGIAAHVQKDARVGFSGRIGLSWRRYHETSTMTFLHVPEEITVEQAAAMLPNSQRTRMRGGLLLGLGVPIQLSTHLVAAPEVRWVWGGPARIASNYRELSAGARVTWRF
jgi:hypothetical protein